MKLPSILLFPICMASCVSYQPLTDRSAETISKELKKGDLVRLKMSYPRGSERINEMVLSGVEGDSLMVGTVSVEAPGERPKQVQRELKISQIAEISKGQVIGVTQEKTRFFLGYNSFNEIYAGFQFPRDSVKKAVVELGYQFALSSSATYSSVANPILTTVASGLRARVGYKIPARPGRFKILYFEYQNLQSGEFYYYESAHKGVPSYPYSAYFTEHYAKYGMKLMSEKPILKSNLFFTYSVAVFFMQTTRQYSWETQGGASNPSDRVEIKYTLTPQVSIGFRVYVF